MRTEANKEGMQVDYKVYVAVDVAFTEEGTMLPKRLTWEDGRHYDIDRVLAVRPAYAEKAGGMGDRYTIRVQGQEKYLFFEHALNPEDACPGRWFMERREEKT